MERRGPCGSISYQPLSRPPITPPLPLRTRPPSSKQGERQKARPLRQLLMQKRMPSLDRHRGGIADSGERGHVNRPRCHSPQGAYQSRIHAPLPRRRVWPWPGAWTHPRGTQSFVDPWAAHRGRLDVDHRWGQSEGLGSLPAERKGSISIPHSITFCKSGGGGQTSGRSDGAETWFRASREHRFDRAEVLRRRTTGGSACSGVFLASRTNTGRTGC
jgi:hypothetical protein